VRKESERKDARASRGFTLVEVQIAILVLLITLFTLGGHVRIYNQLLTGVTADKNVDGYFDLTGERAFLTVSRQGKDAAPPPCDVRVQSVNTGGTYPRVFVIVEEIGP
jgi:hypothetical protein